MLYVYVSSRRPFMLAFLDLPVSCDQRCSPWNRRTRRELRDLAHRILTNKFTEKSDDTGDAGQVTRDHGCKDTTPSPLEGVIAVEMGMWPD